MATPDEMIQRAQQAVRAYKKLDQKQTDSVVGAAYLAAMDNRVRLAKMAAEETFRMSGSTKSSKMLLPAS